MAWGWRFTLLAGCAALTSGCVAAALPLAAAGVIGDKKVRHHHHREPAAQALAPVPASAVAAHDAPPPPPAPVAAPSILPAMQYLYGSGEGSAISQQAWRAMASYVAAAVQGKRPADSVVLAPGASLDWPSFAPCGKKPFAVVLDVDETVLLNLGAEYDAARHPGPFDPKRWDAWERTGADKVVAVPGAAQALSRLRFAGVTVIFNTNRSATNAAQTEAALTGAGLGPAKHGETLFLQGDDATGPHKDGRRASIAARYCVLAMAGDQLGDFSDLFNDGLAPGARRADTLGPAIAGKWGAGWFVLPNPVYGTALNGSLDEIVPADKRWAPAP